MKSQLLLAIMIALSCFKSEAQNTCSAAISSGLIAYFPFCNNANDVSGNSLNGTVTGATLTTDRFGNANSAYSFNGTSNYIQVANNALLNFGTGDFSISAWTYTSSSASEMILHKGSTYSTPQYFFRLHDSPSADVLLLTSSGGVPNESYTGNATASVSNGQWHHVVGVRNAGTLILYFDGAQIYSGALTNRNVTNTFDMFIGCQNNGGTKTNFFNGKLDDIYLFNKALTPVEVNQLHTTNTTSSCVPIISGGLLGYYPFCGNATDASGNGYNGTVNGATLTTDRFGNPNSAYSFNGTTNNISCPITSATVFANGVSFCAWINPTAYNLSSVVDRIQNTGGGFRINTRNAGNGKQVWAEANNYTTPGFAISSSIYNTGQWSFMTGTWTTDDSIKIYLNGVLEGKAKITYDMSAPYPILIGIGQRSTNYEPFAGSIDDVSIYNGELTPCEIQALYNGSLYSTAITGNTAICNGNSTTLSASNGVSYLWNTNSTTSSIAVSPTTGTAYTVTATNAIGCTATASTSISVNQASINGGADQTVCSGNSAVLSASGGVSYQWNPGGQTTSSISVTPSATTTYSVIGSDANGCSNTDSVKVTVVTCTGVQTIAGHSHFSIYPNPADGKFTIQVSENNYGIEITNSIGQKVYSSRINSLKEDIDLSKQPKGVYFIKVLSDGRIIGTEKILIQ